MSFADLSFDNKVHCIVANRTLSQGVAMFCSVICQTWRSQVESEKGWLIYALATSM
jgi:hypothetical protein